MEICEHVMRNYLRYLKFFFAIYSVNSGFYEGQKLKRFNFWTKESSLDLN